MATPFDDLVGRLTHRLKIDPELQQEVAQELRIHLQDCADDFHGGDTSDIQRLGIGCCKNRPARKTRSARDLQSDRPGLNIAGWTEMALSLLLLLNLPKLWKLWRLPKSPADIPRRFSVNLATIPAFLAAALSLGLIAGVPLRFHEKQIAAQLTQDNGSIRFYYLANDHRWPEIQARYARLLLHEQSTTQPTP